MPSYPVSRFTPLLLLFLLAAGCVDSGEATLDSSAEVSSPNSAAGTAAVSHERALLPLPQPTGDAAIGVRIYEYEIDMTRDTVDAGRISFHAVNAGTTAHLLVVRNDEISADTRHLEPGDSAVLEVDLVPGTYSVLCWVRDEFDHISEGERRFLTVR